MIATFMTLNDVLKQNEDDLLDNDVAYLAEWATRRKEQVMPAKIHENTQLKKAYSLIREGADLLLRRRALLRSVCEQVQKEGIAIPIGSIWTNVSNNPFHQRTQYVKVVQIKNDFVLFESQIPNQASITGFIEYQDSMSAELFTTCFVRSSLSSGPTIAFSNATVGQEVSIEYPLQVTTPFSGSTGVTVALSGKTHHP